MLFLLTTVAASAQVKTYKLDSIAGLEARNVKIEAVTFKGKRTVRVTEAAQQSRGDAVALVAGADFDDGTIEVELSGEPAPGAGEGARGFVGIAFRVAPNAARLECLYLRPTNGRADDQVRRNHSVQYIAHPDFPWPRMRKEFPEKYETYVDLVPAGWTRVKIEVEGTKARLYVHGAAQPTLIVNDLKLGVSKGGIGLWIGQGTVGHFANLKVTPR